MIRAEQRLAVRLRRIREKPAEKQLIDQSRCPVAHRRRHFHECAQIIVDDHFARQAELFPGPFFFRFFVRLGKMAGEFFPATLWVVIIQQILRSEGRYYHQLDRGWRFPTRPCFKPHPANFRATG